MFVCFLVHEDTVGAGMLGMHMPSLDHRTACTSGGLLSVTRLVCIPSSLRPPSASQSSHMFYHAATARFTSCVGSTGAKSLVDAVCDRCVPQVDQSALEGLSVQPVVEPVGVATLGRESTLSELEKNHAVLRQYAVLSAAAMWVTREKVLARQKEEDVMESNTNGNGVVTVEEPEMIIPADQRPGCSVGVYLVR